ncbi:GGDEF-domain containing protein [Vibrionales bacterium C3R12]|uniref:bifunctional diguanylate cyclase/phosphodiesterase n=1 Tax=Vibrio cortegadensis TaxID=1328770 RepID=UPI000DEBD715|nr:EAL domain-containing protein [Vibrio cortegadensis]MDN3699314.1 EAL domain-containing protein [Vibrio cortegadensis]RBW64399.1 GGDEF-domain containing protein [Vibrionales bacterium C3R12]
MAELKKNIWTMYTVVLIATMLLFGIFCHSRYQAIEQQATNDQILQLELFVNSTNSLLKSQESLLELIGQQIISQNDYTRTAAIQIRPILDKLLTLHPAIEAFGITNTAGTFIAVSSNLQLAAMPNLMEHETNHEDFINALNSEAIVVGKTYVVPSLEKPVIPIRKALRMPSGEVKAVMTAGLKIQSTMVLSNTSHLNASNSLQLIREDLHPLFVSADGYAENWYKTPMSLATYQTGIAKINQKYGLSEDEVKKSAKSFTISNEHSGNNYLISVRFIPEFNIWAMSQTDRQLLDQQFYSEFVFLSSVFLMIQICFYTLVRSIAKNDRKTREKLLYQATHDHLTGLPNRPYLSDSLSQWLDLPSETFYLLYIDIDNFKSVNEAHGHTFGDKILIDISERLKTCVTPSDILIRKVSDEFIVMVKKHNVQDLRKFADNIQDKLSKPYTIDGNQFLLGSSIGIATYPEHGGNLDELLRAADISMFQAKKERNASIMFNSEMQAQHLQTMAIEQKLRLAIENQELFMVYQPQFDMEGNLYGVEALVRWIDTKLGFVPPNVFIPIAEKSGLMPKLGKFIIERSLSDISQLPQAMSNDLRLSLNISERQFMQVDFVPHLMKSLSYSKFNANNLTIEITENLFIEDLDYVKPICEQLHQLGIKISLDDFGTGYSSLSMLKALPIDELKVDKSFIDNIHSDHQSLTMVKNIIAIGKIFEMVVLAEGVETNDQKNVLRECQCDLLQGYLYSKPISPEELKAFTLEKMKQTAL